MLTTSLFDKAGLSSEFLNPESKVSNPIMDKSKSTVSTSNIFSRILSNKAVSNFLFFALGIVCTVFFVYLAGNNIEIKDKKLSTIFDNNSNQSNFTENQINSNSDINKKKNRNSHANILLKNNILKNDSDNQQIVYKNKQNIYDKDKIEKIQGTRPVRTIDNLAFNKIYHNSPMSKDFQINIEKVNIENHSEESSNLLSNFSFDLIGYCGLIYSPNRQFINSSPPNINNIAGAISYEINKGNSIGLEGGIESYPIFVKDKNNNLMPTNSLSYLGGFYKFDLGYYNYLGKFIPNFKLFAGGTLTGLLLKESVGFSYYPENIV
jgi:hypothetical protein